jgi:hypothetical protein
VNELLTERSGSVLKVQLNRPAKKNAMTAAMYSGLADLLSGADQDDNVNVVLLRVPEFGSSFLLQREQFQLLDAIQGGGRIFARGAHFSHSRFSRDVRSAGVCRLSGDPASLQPVELLRLRRQGADFLCRSGADDDQPSAAVRGKQSK